MISNWMQTTFCLLCMFSKKYLISHLTRACINYLETSLTASNVCLLLTEIRLFEEKELMQRYNSVAFIL